MLIYANAYLTLINVYAIKKYACKTVFENHVVINGQIFLTLIDNKITFRVIITIIMHNPCNMPKYVPRLEVIMHSP